MISQQHNDLPPLDVQETVARAQQEIRRELDSYRSAISDAFNEGFAMAQFRGPLRDAWERSEARQAEATFAFTRISVGAVLDSLLAALATAHQAHEELAEAVDSARDELRNLYNALVLNFDSAPERLVRDVGKASFESVNRSLDILDVPFKKWCGDAAVLRTKWPQKAHPDCPRCGGTGECSNAQFHCMCRWHRRGCALVHSSGDCDCKERTQATREAIARAEQAEAALATAQLEIQELKKELQGLPVVRGASSDDQPPEPERTAQ